MLLNVKYGRVAKLVYASVLGTDGAIRGGSSPLSLTNKKTINKIDSFFICEREAQLLKKVLRGLEKLLR